MDQQNIYLFSVKSMKTSSFDITDALQDFTKLQDDDSDWSVPLILSSLAGLSTCIGAAVAFCLRLDSKHGKKIEIKHTYMSFSLALAGSVMITVSMASILPESFLLDDDVHYAPIGSYDFWQRCIAFTVGCALYVVLSKSVFPEPIEVIGLSFDENDSSSSSITLKQTGIDGIGGSEDDLLLLLLDDDDIEATPTRPLTVNTSGGSASTTIKRKKQSNTSIDDPMYESYNVEYLHSDKLSPPGKNKVTDRTIPSIFNNISKYTRGSDLIDPEARRKWRVTMLLFISLAIHNFPEGLAVAASAMHSPHLGITTSIAIALHNIPEGIAIAIPCLAARPDLPWLAFGLACLSGLAEPLGAIVALSVIDRKSGDTNIEQMNVSIVWKIWNSMYNMKNVLSFVAGIMITVAVVELFPEAKRHMKTNSFPGILGLVVGAVIMLLSDAYLQIEIT